jgi:hypothetical protein
VNRSCLFLRALSRTPRNPWDILAPFCVGRMLGSMAFSLVTGLPSTTSAAGVSTHFVRRLRWYYAHVRLLAGVPARIALLASRTGPEADKPRKPTRSLGSRGPRGHPVSRRAYGSRTTPGLMETRDVVSASVAFPLQALGRRLEFVFRSSIPRPSMPLSTLHPAPRGTQRKTRGQDGSLLLSGGALSSPTARRFIPTIALAKRAALFIWALLGA